MKRALGMYFFLSCCLSRYLLCPFLPLSSSRKRTCVDETSRHPFPLESRLGLAHGSHRQERAEEEEGGTSVPCTSARLLGSLVPGACSPSIPVLSFSWWPELHQGPAPAPSPHPGLPIVISPAHSSENAPSYNCLSYLCESPAQAG